MEVLPNEVCAKIASYVDPTTLKYEFKYDCIIPSDWSGTKQIRNYDDVHFFIKLNVNIVYGDQANIQIFNRHILTVCYKNYKIDRVGWSNIKKKHIMTAGVRYADGKLLINIPHYIKCMIKINKNEIIKIFNDFEKYIEDAVNKIENNDS